MLLRPCGFLKCGRNFFLLLGLNFGLNDSLDLQSFIKHVVIIGIHTSKCRLMCRSLYFVDLFSEEGTSVLTERRRTAHVNAHLHVYA